MIETFLAMDPWTMAAFAGAMVVLMITPGPNMMFSIACGLAGGPRAGVAAALGATAGMAVHTGVAAAGLSAVLLASPWAYDALRYGGAAYLVWLAWSSWRAGAELEGRLGRQRVARAFLRGFVVNLMNPKVILFMVAFLPQFADPAVGPVWRQIVILGVAVVAITALFDSLYGGLAGFLADRVRRASRLMNRISAVVFGGLAARILAE